MSAHDTGDDVQEELQALRAEVKELRTLIQTRLRTPAFYTEEINEALAAWLKAPKNVATLAKAVDKAVDKLQ